MATATTNHPLSVHDLRGRWKPHKDRLLAEQADQSTSIRLMDDDRDEAQRLLRHAHNSLSAFSEIQALFDPMGLGTQDEN